MFHQLEDVFLYDEITSNFRFEGEWKRVSIVSGTNGGKAYHGGSGMIGGSINNLLVFFEEKMQEMEFHIGVSVVSLFMVAAGDSTRKLKEVFSVNKII